MKHDYEKAHRGAVIESTGKTRVTMYLDDDVIEHFRKLATKNGRGYQTEINSQLREAMGGERQKTISDTFVKELDEIHGIREKLNLLVKHVGKVESDVLYVRDNLCQSMMNIGSASGSIGGVRIYEAGYAITGRAVPARKREGGHAPGKSGKRPSVKILDK